jgi:hypothetical protein
MDQSKMLVNNHTMGSVFKCAGGVIHVNLHGISLHFNEFAFLQFARMLQEASSKLMDDGLRVLMEDTE